MIHPDSRTYEWIDKVATDNGVKDKSLAEKTNAAKAAYLSKLIELGETEVHHFDKSDIKALSDAVISAPLPTKFNKFKKSSIEAFFYWNEVQKLIDGKF